MMPHKQISAVFVPLDLHANNKNRIKYLPHFLPEPTKLLIFAYKIKNCGIIQRSCHKPEQEQRKNIAAKPF